MTVERATRFRYPLQVLVQKHAWDVDMLSTELANARQALKEHERQSVRLRQAVQISNANLARMRSDGAILDLTRERVLIGYRQVQDEAVIAQEAELQCAHTLCEQITEQLTRARRTLRGFEDHSDRLRVAHAVEADRSASRDADDAWLVTCGWKERN